MGAGDSSDIIPAPLLLYLIVILGIFHENTSVKPYSIEPDQFPGNAIAAHVVIMEKVGGKTKDILKYCLLIAKMNFLSQVRVFSIPWLLSYELKTERNRSQQSQN